MAKVDLIGRKAMNTVISHEEGVKAVVYQHAAEIYSKASAKLEMHREDYVAYVDITRGEVDTTVGLNDQAALSIEFGHYLGSRSLGTTRRYIPGLDLFQGSRYKDA